MKRTLQIAGILFVLLVVAALALPFLIDANQFRPALAAELTKALGREVKVGDLKLAIFSGGVAASGLSIADDAAFQRGDFIRANRLDITVEILPLLLSRKLNVTALTIDQPEIALIQSAKGTWNFSSLGGGAPAAKTATSAATGASAPPDLTVRLIKITNGRVSLQMPGNPRPQVLEKVGAELRDFSAASSFPFSFAGNIQGGGDLKLDGKAGPIQTSDAALTPFEARLKLTKLDLVPAGFIAPSTGLSGLLSVDGNVSSNGHALQVNGKIQGDQLTLVKGGTPAKKTVAFDFLLDHDLEKRSGRLSRGDVHMGSAQASLTGTYRMEEAGTTINMKLAGPKMAVQELAGMLPAMNIVLPSGSSLQGGTASANLTVEGPSGKLVADGSLGVSNTQLTGFDLGSKMSTIAKLAGLNVSPNTSIQTLSAHVHSDDQGVRLDHISLIVPDLGELSGGGTISPAQQLDFKMQAKVRGSGGLLAAAGAKGETSVPFSITGTSANPKFTPDVKAMATEQLKSLKGPAAEKATGLIKGILGGKQKK